MTPSTLTRGRRLLAGTTVAALTAGALALAPTTAHAADVATPTLQWKISETFGAHLGTHTLSGGATESADKVVSFVDGATSYDASTGVTEVDYDGSVTGAFAMAGTRYYEVTVANPTVEVAASGAGRITADVSSASRPSARARPRRPTPARVTVTTFDAASAAWSSSARRATLKATPAWAGVLAPGSSTAVDLGITNTAQPVEGRSFSPEFLGALVPSVRAHFYWSTGSDAKAPAAFSATFDQVAPRVVSATGVSARYGKGGTVSVTAPVAGTVSVAGLGSKVVSAGGTAAFAVSRKQTAGTRSYRVTFAPADTSLTAPAATTVTVKIAKTAAAKGKVKVTRKPTSKKKGLAVVSVKGASGAAAPTGKVKIKLTKGKKSKYVTANLSSGKRTVKLPKLAKGKWVVRVAYYGNANYTKRGYVKAGSFKVAK